MIWQTVNVADRRTDRNKSEPVTEAEKERVRVAVWQHVCTAEHKLKKPRPLSHTPLGPKLHGVLHSTHKQPPGKASGCMGEAGGTPGWPARNNNCLFTSAQCFQITERDKRRRQRGLAKDQRLHLSKFRLLRFHSYSLNRRTKIGQKY